MAYNNTSTVAKQRGEKIEQDDKFFKRVKEANTKEVEELNDMIISLKQMCMKLKYGSKQGKQNKKKKNLRLSATPYKNRIR